MFTRFTPLIALLALALAGCSPKPAPEPAAEPEAAEAAASGVVELPASSPIAIATATVAPRALATTKDVLGQITYRSDGETLVHAPVEAQIVAVHAQLGDRVAAGQPLVTIRSLPLGEAQAAYLKALGEYKLDNKNHQRQVRLFGAQLASKKELDESTQALEVAKLQLTAASEKLRVLGFDEASIQALGARGRVEVTTSVRAPRAGTIVARSASVGDLVGPSDAEHLFRLLDLSTVRIEADLPERDFLAVRAGQPASVRLEAMGGRVVTGRVIKLSPVLDQQSRTGRALIDVPNGDGQLRPGMSCRVVIDTGARTALAVPTSAVQEEAGKAFTYVSMGDRRYRETPVSVGAHADGWVEITQGLQAGEAVVTKGSFDLRSQARKAQFGGE